MTLLITRRTLLAATATFAVPQFAAAQGATHEIQMLNKHPEDAKKRMVFYPLIQVGQPGDTFTFKAVDKGHNSVSIEGMIPEGAEAWKGQISKEVSATLQQPGVYGYRCVPHQAVGMVGLIIIQGPGMTDNVEAAKAVKHRGKARAVFQEIWAQVETDGLLA